VTGRRRAVQPTRRIPIRAADLSTDLAARQSVAYKCQRGHTFDVVFLAGITPPAEWECRCGKPATLADAKPGPAPELVRRMTDVRGRGRTDAQLQQLIDDRLADRRQTA
jgi:RNA polymerase-binding protein